MYPNFRITVEAVLIHKQKLLIMKRSADAKIAPNVWSVPAGKAKYEETPKEAVIREAFEETGIAVNVQKELSVRTFQGVNVDGETYYRCIFSYFVTPKNEMNCEVHLNDEHSEYKWVSLAELEDDTYASFDPFLKNVLANLFE